MLLNLSNHPVILWPDLQQKMANQFYGTIIDMPFPSINPDLESDQLELLVDDYEVSVKNMKPTAVHIMGELTFVFRLVNRLKENGIKCIASTTERNATTENNIKTSNFTFVQFREY